MSNCAMRRTFAGSAATAAKAIEQATTARACARERGAAMQRYSATSSTGWHSYSLALKRALEHAHDVDRLARPPATRQVGDLVPAARAVGDDQRVRRRRADGRHQRELGHAHGDVVVCGIVPETSRHSATARLDEIHAELGDEAQHRLRRRYGIERFLVAVRVQERLLLRQRRTRRGASFSARSPRARNSSISSACCAKRRASSPSPITRNSSRIERRQDGSRPTTAAPRATCGRSAATTRRASAFASSTRPAAR